MTARHLISEFRLYIINNFANAVPSHGIRKLLYRRFMGFRIAGTASIHLRARFDAPGGLTMGHNSVIGREARVDTRAGVHIGDNVSISEQVIILTADHDIRHSNFHSREKAVRLADWAFVGTRAMILPGCSLGEGAVLAAGSVLTKNIPSYEIWAGIPAARIGIRPRNLAYSTKYLRPFS